MAGEINTIFVPTGWSIEQVWEALKRGDKVEGKNPTEGPGLKYGDVRGTWVNVDGNGKLVG